MEPHVGVATDEEIPIQRIVVVKQLIRNNEIYHTREVVQHRVHQSMGSHYRQVVPN